MYMYIHVYTCIYVYTCTVFPRLSATFGETVNIGGKRGWRMIENKTIITPTPRYLLNLTLIWHSTAKQLEIVYV